MRRRTAVLVAAALLAPAALAACGEDDAQQAASPADGTAPRSSASPSVTVDPGSESSGPAWDVAGRLDCAVDVQGSTAAEGIEYMAPVRGGVMSDAVQCTLPGGDQVHVFARDPARPALSTDEVARAFSHGPGEAAPTDVPHAGCDPWLVIGPTWVVQLVSETAAADVAAALAPDARAPERTTRTPISLVPPPCPAG